MLLTPLYHEMIYMGLYFKNLKIDNLYNIASLTGIEISRLYWDDKIIFQTAEYDIYNGTLPAQYTTDDLYLNDYKIYGSSGGVGDATESEEPVGHKLSFSIVDNFWTSEMKQGGLQNSANIGSSYDYVTSFPTASRITNEEPMPANGNVIYFNDKQYAMYICYFDENFLYIGDSYSDNVISSPFITKNYPYMAISIRIIDGGIISPSSFNDVNLILASDIFEQLIIYIGDKLEANEYLSFSEQKIYRVINDSLTPTNPPVQLPRFPSRKGVNIVKYIGKQYTNSDNIFYSAAASSQTSGNLTVTCDGEGRYSINKTGSGDLYVYFDIPEFTIPISVAGGGTGTVSFFNTMSSNAKIFFMYDNSTIDSWNMNTVNRQTNSYGTMAGKTINRIGFNIWGGSMTGNINIMFTDNSTLPSTFIPPRAALPAISRFYAKYKITP